MTAARRTRKTHDPILVAQAFYAELATGVSKSEALRRVGLARGHSRQWADKQVRAYEGRKRPAPRDVFVMSRAPGTDALHLHHSELQRKLILWTPADAQNARGESAAILLGQVAIVTVLTSAGVVAATGHGALGAVLAGWCMLWAWLARRG